MSSSSRYAQLSAIVSRTSGWVFSYLSKRSNCKSMYLSMFGFLQARIWSTIVGNIFAKGRKSPSTHASKGTTAARSSMSMNFQRPRKNEESSHARPTATFQSNCSPSLPGPRTEVSFRPRVRMSLDLCGSSPIYAYRATRAQGQPPQGRKLHM